MTDRLPLILQLRAEGWTYQAIGERLGVSRQRVWGIVRAEARRREIVELAARKRDALDA